MKGGKFVKGGRVVVDDLPTFDNRIIFDKNQVKILTKQFFYPRGFMCAQSLFSRFRVEVLNFARGVTRAAHRFQTKGWGSDNRRLTLPLAFEKHPFFGLASGSSYLIVSPSSSLLFACTISLVSPSLPLDGCTHPYALSVRLSVPLTPVFLLTYKSECVLLYFHCCIWFYSRFFREMGRSKNCSEYA